MCYNLKMMKHLDIKIFGRVQGVFFRHLAKKKAEEFGISGLAFNQPDGTVYLEVEGKETDLERFLKWCSKGPETAKVEKVESNFSNDLRNYENFEIK